MYGYGYCQVPPIRNKGFSDKQLNISIGICLILPSDNNPDKDICFSTYIFYLSFNVH